MVLVPRVPAGRAVLDGLSPVTKKLRRKTKNQPTLPNSLLLHQNCASQAPAAGPHLASRHALLQRRHT